jgi:hypothetical protein
LGEEHIDGQELVSTVAGRSVSHGDVVLPGLVGQRRNKLNYFKTMFTTGHNVGDTQHDNQQVSQRPDGDVWV